VPEPPRGVGYALDAALGAGNVFGACGIVVEVLVMLLSEGWGVRGVCCWRWRWRWRDTEYKAEGDEP
jgi:hypothetical protein